MRLESRKEQITRSHPDLSVNRQLSLLSVPHSSYYYPENERIERKRFDAQAKDKMQKIYETTPFYGVRRMTVELKRQGLAINHKHVARLHREMGLETIYPHKKLNTSQSNPEHPFYPYLLRDKEIIRPNQVWSTDITYTKVNGHKAFVIAIIDWFSRMVLAHCTVNTMDTYYCVKLLHEAVGKYGKPEIFNSDQGSQFTSRCFVDALKSYGIRISMDGKGRCRDNARMERFWWALKYEDLNLHCYESMQELRAGVDRYVEFYNKKRIHSALKYQTPENIYQTWKEAHLVA